MTPIEILLFCLLCAHCGGSVLLWLRLRQVVESQRRVIEMLGGDSKEWQSKTSIPPLRVRIEKYLNLMKRQQEPVRGRDYI